MKLLKLLSRRSPCWSKSHPLGCSSLKFGMLSHRLVHGNHCFGRTNNARGLQWRPSRNVRKTARQRESWMNFKQPPFESKGRTTYWANKTWWVKSLSGYTGGKGTSRSQLQVWKNNHHAPRRAFLHWTETWLLQTHLMLDRRPAWSWELDVGGSRRGIWPM